MGWNHQLGNVMIPVGFQSILDGVPSILKATATPAAFFLRGATGVSTDPQVRVRKLENCKRSLKGDGK